MNHRMKRAYFLMVLATPFFASNAAHARTPLTAQPANTLAGPAAHFDFMAADPEMGRVLAAHKGANSLLVLDTRSRRPIGSIKTGAAQGVAVDVKGARYFVGDDDEKKVVIINAKTLTVAGEVAVSGPVDAIAFDAKNGMIYADEDNGKSVWVIDPNLKKVVATISIPGEPEFIDYDPTTDRLYQNIMNKDEIVVINPSTNRIEATWSTLPASSPHGLTIDSKRGRVFSAGSNGKLVGIEMKTGKVFSNVDIVLRVDQIAFDSAKDVIYCAGKGQISAIKASDGSLQPLGNTPSPAGAKTLAIDSNTHSIWVSYSDKNHSYLQEFKLSL